MGGCVLPGQYPLEPQMRVSDLIRAGGSLEDAAYGGQAELSRYQVVNGEYRQTELIDIDLAAVLRGDPAADIVLQPYDALNIKEVPQWRELETVSIEGEVRFPGIYPIQRGETLRQVLQRAGGLSDLAFPFGAIFHAGRAAKTRATAAGSPWRTPASRSGRAGAARRAE